MIHEFWREFLPGALLGEELCYQQRIHVDLHPVWGVDYFQPQSSKATQRNQPNVSQTNQQKAPPWNFQTTISAPEMGEISTFLKGNPATNGSTFFEPKKNQKCLNTHENIPKHLSKLEYITNLKYKVILGNKNNNIYIYIIPHMHTLYRDKS